MEAHMREFGVEPMCRVLQIAPSTWYEHARRKADRGRLPRRAKRDGELSVHIRRVFEDNFGVYGVRKVWRQLRREDVDVARCTVARLMKAMGLQGVVRGKRMKTTINDKATPCPLDKVNRQFAADKPTKLWVSDFTDICTFDFEFRPLATDDVERLMDEVMAHARERLEPEMRAVDTAARIVFKQISEFPGLETPASRDVVGLAKRLAGSNEHGKVAYGTEAGLFALAGIPTVVIGPGSSTRRTRPMSTSWSRSSKCAAPSSTGSSRIRAGVLDTSTSPPKE